MATTTAEVLLGNQALVANVCNRVEFPRTQHSTAQNTKHRGKKAKNEEEEVGFGDSDTQDTKNWLNNNWSASKRRRRMGHTELTLS